MLSGRRSRYTSIRGCRSPPSKRSSTGRWARWRSHTAGRRATTMRCSSTRRIRSRRGASRATGTQHARLRTCGVCVMPIGGMQVAFVSLVDLKTGQVVWFNTLAASAGEFARLKAPRRWWTRFSTRWNRARSQKRKQRPNGARSERLLSPPVSAFALRVRALFCVRRVVCQGAAHTAHARSHAGYAPSDKDERGLWQTCAQLEEESPLPLAYEGCRTERLSLGRAATAHRRASQDDPRICDAPTRLQCLHVSERHDDREQRSARSRAK